MNTFVLYPANKFIWNRNEFIQFLIDNIGQPISISTNTEGPCLESCGVYRLLEQFRYTDVTIKTSNLLERHAKFKIESEIPFSFFRLMPTDYSSCHHWNQQYVFGCFYNRPLWHRIGLASILQHDYADKTLINIRWNPNDIDQRQLFELQDLFYNCPDSFSKFSQVMQTWPKQLEVTDGYTLKGTTKKHTDQLMQFYPNFLIDIVGETWITGRTFFLTEKTLRPILLKKPMIVMGSASALMYLRRMGFKTFWEFWDEDYDGYSEQARYNKIVELINNISKKSNNELMEMYDRMQPILDHNYNLLVSGNYNKEFKHE